MGNSHFRFTVETRMIRLDWGYILRFYLDKKRLKSSWNTPFNLFPFNASKTLFTRYYQVWTFSSSNWVPSETCFACLFLTTKHEPFIYAKFTSITNYFCSPLFSRPLSFCLFRRFSSWRFSNLFSFYANFFSDC